MNSKGVKIIYRVGKKKWFGEFTLQDYKKGLGWSQWGASPDCLSKSSCLTERFANEYINSYHL